jgi:hypothetical protein
MGKTDPVTSIDPLDVSATLLLAKAAPAVTRSRTTLAPQNRKIPSSRVARPNGRFSPSHLGNGRKPPG